MLVNYFLGAAQGPYQLCRKVRCALFHSIGKVFCPLDIIENPYHKELILMKKLDVGECSWSNFHKLLGWVVNTV